MGRRMQGQDKGWVMLDDKPMIEWVTDRLEPQVDQLMINANRNVDRYQQFNHQIIEDEIKGFQGPLAGILSGLKKSETEFLVCVPCDTPFFPEDLVLRMLEVEQATCADIISVNDGVRTHPVFALIKTDLKKSLEEYLHSGERKIDRWYQQHNYQLLGYQDGEHFFENINTVDQLRDAELRIKSNG